MVDSLLDVKSETNINTLNIALVGNPNTGKTSVFNALTGLRQKVSNYAGVTVEKKVGTFKVAGKTYKVYDLPGLYSLIPKSLDDKIASDILIESNTDDLKLIVIVVDAGNLSRNLYLLSQILDIGIPVVVALNMMDIAEKNGIHIDIEGLEKAFGISIVPIIANKKTGIDNLRGTICATIENESSEPPNKLNINEDIAPHLISIKKLIKNGNNHPDSLTQSQALRFISSDMAFEAWLDRKDQTVKKDEIKEQIVLSREALKQKGYHWSMLETKLRYDWIDKIVKENTRSKPGVSQSISDKLDKVLTNRFAGPVIFLTVFAFIFQTIFSWAEYPMNAIDALMGLLGDLAARVIPNGALQSMVIDGAIAGVGAILIFLPQILFLFFFLSLMEDTGYMARVAFMLDRLMRIMGLSGRSVIPLLSSFACAIPGIMASRTIQNWRDRLITIMISPFMSCSARLPVYVLMTAVFIPQGVFLGIISYSAITLIVLYTVGILTAVVVALIFQKILSKSLPASTSFVMELPPYRRPSLRWTSLQMLERAKVFVKDAGKIILAMSIVLWFLASYPKADSNEQLTAAQKIENSYAGKLGKFIEPVIKPLGFDWKIGIGLLTSFAAREVMVSTMATIYNIEGEDETSVNLRTALREDVDPETGKPLYSPLMAASLMVFFALACQCMATVAIVKRETNSWRWPIAMVAYMTVLAYLSSLAVYQGGLVLGLG